VKRDLTPWAILWAAAFIAACLIFSACDPTPVLYKTVAVGAPVIAGGYRALEAADKDAQEKIQAKAKAGDPAGAKLDLAAHLKHYDAAAIALDTTMATAQTALDSAPALKAAHDKRATLDLVGTLLQLYLDVRDALKPFGVDITIPTAVQ
jgi:hypothetical protein